MQIDARIRFMLGSEPKISDLRDFVEKTKTLDGGTPISFSLSRGQRDQESVTVIVQAAALLDGD